MDNIIFYVHRTGLLHYFVDPICSFLYKEYNIYIFHLDKKNGYSYAPQTSSLYTTIDLSDKTISEIEDLFEKINPTVCISLGFISIYELLIQRIAKKKNIKTIFLEHGLYSKETSSLSIKKLLRNFATTARKNLFFLKRYWEFAVSSGDFKSELRIFWLCFRKKQYQFSKYDKALFFSTYGFEKINDFFQYSNEEVDYVCYPIAKTDSEYDYYKSIANEPLAMEKKATFIHQPFILDGLAKWGYEDEREYFLQIAGILKENGYGLSIQIHPRENMGLYKNLFKDTEVQVSQGMERRDFKKYSLVLGHYSTALLYPIFFKIPIMLVDYPDVCKAEESVFYPISCSIPIENVESQMVKYESFCDEYIGRGSCSFESIARKIGEVIGRI